MDLRRLSIELAEEKAVFNPDPPNPVLGVHQLRRRPTQTPLRPRLDLPCLAGGSRPGKKQQLLEARFPRRSHHVVRAVPRRVVVSPGVLVLENRPPSSAVAEVSQGAAPRKPNPPDGDVSPSTRCCLPRRRRKRQLSPQNAFRIPPEKTVESAAIRAPLVVQARTAEEKQAQGLCPHRTRHIRPGISVLRHGVGEDET